MISFTLFRVQVTIHPSLWVMLLLLSALFTGFSAGVPGVALFAVALFLCLLTHEMGHSLVGRCLGGGQPEIYLAWLGADSCNESARLTRTQGILMTAAGPLASLLPVLLVTIVLTFILGNPADALAVLGGLLQGQIPAVFMEMYPPMVMVFALYLVQISVWWSLLNLLPVFPLDGGQIMHGLMRSTQSMHRLSLAFACFLTFFFLILGSLWMVFVMGALALFNYRCMQNQPD